MRIYYLPDGKVINLVFEKDLDSGSLPAFDYIDIDEIGANKNLLSDVFTSLTGGSDVFTVSGGSLFRNGIEVSLTVDVDRQDFKTQYQNAITRLQANIDRPVQDWTQLIVVQEIVFLSRVLLNVLKLMARTLK